MASFVPRENLSHLTMENVQLLKIWIVKKLHSGKHWLTIKLGWLDPHQFDQWCIYRIYIGSMRVIIIALSQLVRIGGLIKER